MAKRGNKSRKPSHVRYHSENRRVTNKLRRILKCNGADFLADWKSKIR